MIALHVAAGILAAFFIIYLLPFAFVGVWIVLGLLCSLVLYVFDFILICYYKAFKGGN